MCFVVASQNFSLYPVAGINQSIADYVELGYSPSTMPSLSQGTPVYSPGDSLWILSNSQYVASAQLISPRGSSVANLPLRAESVSLIYSFSQNDQEGD
jgi:hypothetical protein